MGRFRKTRSPVYVKLSETRIRQIEELIGHWSFETRLFVLRRLRQFHPSHSLFRLLADWWRRTFWPRERRFVHLRDPEKLSDWRRRIEVSGSQNAAATWAKILERELDLHDYRYLRHRLEELTADIYVPPALRELFEKIYHVHVLKEYSEDPSVPRNPLVLVIGPSGSGKSVTVQEAMEQAIFRKEARPVVDLKAKKEEVMADQPVWARLEDVDFELAVAIERHRKVELLRFLSRLPLVKYLYRKRISRALSTLAEEGVLVDYAMITPNDYQTAWAGEPGNYLRKAMGDPWRLCIRHLEEAHSAFGRPDQTSPVKAQQSTLVDAANIILDEIAHGRRDCLVIATTDQPESLDPTIYRRFVEGGLVIDIDEYWQTPENLREVVRMELRRHNFTFGEESAPARRLLSETDLDRTVELLAPIFRGRSLRMTPAYVRRLIGSVISLNGGFEPEYLDDQFLVRDALKAVARNVHGAIYNKVVGKMDRSVKWSEYIGQIKNEFSEMANNALYYNVSEEKGVVLTGPPGSGKTYMVQAWLGDNLEVQDLAVQLNDLVDPMTPLEGMVANLERVYDIAKMLSPAMVFFDEGDAVAPRRSPQGGSPYDKVTNKFLSIIDGETPLNRVFTVLTTNRLDILDPALIRSKRLKVLNVTGHLRDEDALRIIRKELAGIPLVEGLDHVDLVRTARGLCETPADFTAFAEKVRSLRATEIEVLQKLRQAVDGSMEERARFVRFNYKILLGLLEGAAGDSALALKARQGEEELLRHLDRIAQRFLHLLEEKDYPVSLWHLQSARQQLAGSPTRKGKQDLDKFLETELSEVPQVGFVVGVGANDTSGVLLPIATSLVYRVFAEKIVVTGAVSTTAPGAAELDLAVQMTRQSAQEALTLVENYLQQLCPEFNVSRVLGEYLDGYTIHHQLLTASYSVGGPSAGFALAINTLSVLLNLPVLNDFGITGAPWTKGARPGEVGASVIIGGHHKKAEKVLQYLPRMYVPLANYRDFEPELLEAYRVEGRDIQGVASFSALVPEVFFFGDDSRRRLQELVGERIRLELDRAHGVPHPRCEEQLRQALRQLRDQTEAEIARRMRAIRDYLGEPGDRDLSLHAVFSDMRQDAAGQHP
ncbi:ATPase family protein associated with various cellular activities (AAA) [Geothermobacter ehrlichii]|uniref:ATPase family protein associated with various cellular activities (AAA) n=1 Tax=Geothermobacter ehrlichii TaxID=213224 RepID=A0A5D3WMW4_9BACT|nr:AAA family ATPase [Geothermobacter ehrlichii]TYO98930.1 ATPase family protein associated with various cellular activities (AAA) [Geothermobacter ehrlichii]